jgi:hypothetical protein
MRIYVLFGQRKCRYEGEYAPEALAVIDEFGMDENPKYLEEKKEECVLSNDFVSLDIIPVEIPSKDIRTRLGLDQIPLLGVVK